MGESVNGVTVPSGPAVFFLGMAVAAYVGLLFHAVRTRGRRVGIGFFAVAGLLSFARDVWFVEMKGGGAYEFLLPFRVWGVPPLAFVGWTVTFYLGWCVADGLRARLPFGGDRLFVGLAIAYAVMAAVSIAVEPTGVEVGLWRWRRLDVAEATGAREVLAAYGPIGLLWARFGAKILGLYWFIEISDVRRRPARFLVLLAPVALRVLTSAMRLRVDFFFPFVLVLLAVVVPTRFDPPPPARVAGRFVRAIPLAAGLAVTGTLLVLDLAFHRRVDHALMKLPLFVLLLAARQAA
jgi:hypothetical protein